MAPVSTAQYSNIFIENFDVCGQGTLPICGWNTTGSGSRWTTTNSACMINGSYSLSVGSDVTYCEYNADFGTSNRIAYKDFSSLGYQSLDISFLWKCDGEATVDFGRVVYSTDGITWNNVAPTQYQSQPGTQTVTNLALPTVMENDNSVFIGFRWIDNGNGVGGFPGFTIDDIVIRAEQREPPDPPNPVGVSVFCDSATITFGGTPPSPSNVVWYWQGTTCGTSTVLGSNPNTTVYASGTYYLRAYNTVSGIWSPGCGSVAVIVDTPPPTANAGPGGNECDLDFVFNAVPSIGTGTWYQQSGPGLSAFSNVNDPNATVIVTGYGTYVFEWVEANGACTDTASVTVNFFDQPNANAGSGGNECDLDFTFNAIPSVGVGSWSMFSGPGTATFSNPADPNDLVTVSAYGTYVFLWLEGNAMCSDSDTVSVNFFEQPIANAGTGGDECDLDFTFSAVSSVGIGTWIQQFGPGISAFSNINDPNATVTVTMPGTYIFRWTEVNGVCSDFDEINVNLFEQPIANAGTGGDACSLDFTLNATSSAGTGTWTQQSGPGASSFSNVNSPNATVTVTVYGAYIFIWTENNGPCFDFDSITVNFYEQPLADAGAGSDECVLNYTFNATPSVGTGTWTIQVAPGIVTFSDPNDPNATVSVIVPGTYVFRWTEVNGSCSDYDEVIVNFYQQPVADAGTNGDACGFVSTFNTTTSAGIGTWSQQSGPGTSTFSNLNSPTTSVTVTQYGAYVYVWTEVNGPCTDLDTVAITFYEQPAADAGSGGNECGLNFAFNATPSVGSGVWSLNLGTGTVAFTDSTSPNDTVTVSNPGTYVFRWTETNGTCSDYDDIAVNFFLQQTISAGNDTSISLGDNIVLNGTGGELYLWSPDSSLSDPYSSNPVADPVVTTTYIMTATDLNGCIDVDSVTVTVIPDFDFTPSNLMTPNKDGFNDTWYVDNIEFYSTCEVFIYNRYGNLLYSKSGYLNDWDGTYNGGELPDGTYYYVIKCSDSEKIFKGPLTIMRRN